MTASRMPRSARRTDVAPDMKRLAELRQPVAGLAGILVVLPIFVLVVFAAGSAETALRLVGPVVTFGLPVVAMIAFWWDDWPGVVFPGQWSPLSDTVVAAVAAIACTLLGQAVVDRVDLSSLTDPFPGPGHTALFPATLPLAAGVFTAMLQLTLVGEGFPVRRLPLVPAGAAALGLCWVVGAAGYLLVVRGHLAPAGSYGAWLTVTGVWQVVPYVVLRGWPFTAIHRPHLRRLAGNVTVVAGGWASYLFARAVVGWPPSRITAVAGCAIAAALLIGILFAAWPLDRWRPAVGRWVVVAAVAAITPLIYTVLRLCVADHVWRPGAEADDWIAFAALNGLGLAIILHVAIWRRWPLRVADETGEEMDHMDEPVQRVVEAANANDTEAFLAAFTPDGVVDDWGREFRGPQRIREWSDREFIGKQVALTVKDIRRHGANTTITVTVGGAGYTGPGHFSFQVTGDKVSRMTIRA